jgi:hypothetical protein
MTITVETAYLNYLEIIHPIDKTHISADWSLQKPVRPILTKADFILPRVSFLCWTVSHLVNTSLISSGNWLVGFCGKSLSTIPVTSWVHVCFWRRSVKLITGPESMNVASGALLSSQVCGWWGMMFVHCVTNSVELSQVSSITPSKWTQFTERTLRFQIDLHSIITTIRKKLSR